MRKSKNAEGYSSAAVTPIQLIFAQSNFSPQITPKTDLNKNRRCRMLHPCRYVLECPGSAVYKYLYKIVNKKRSTICFIIEGKCFKVNFAITKYEKLPCSHLKIRLLYFKPRTNYLKFWRNLKIFQKIFAPF